MSNNNPLITYLDDTIRRLVGPLELVLREPRWEKHRMESRGSALLMSELTVVTLIFAHADSRVAEEEIDILNYFRDAALIKESLTHISDDYTKLCQTFLSAYPETILSIDHTPFCIQHLQIYDREHDTEYAKTARDLFFRLAKSLVDADAVTTAEEKIALLNFRETLYGENDELASKSLVVTNGEDSTVECPQCGIVNGTTEEFCRGCGRILSPDDPNLAKYFSRSSSELAVPLRQYFAEQGFADDDPLNWIAEDLFKAGSIMADSSGDLSDAEISKIREIYSLVKPGYDPSISTRGRAQAVALLQGKVFSGHLPTIVQALSNFDSKHGTDHVTKAKAMLFRFANSVIKADGTVTDDEKTALQRYKELLDSAADGSLETLEEICIPTASVATVALDQPTTARMDETDGRLSALMAELNSLVGLEAVKSEVTQLVNFLTVQRLRKSKGLSTPAISRHLVFYGNPGTGKTTVARLLAQIYRSLGILSRGQLIETSRAGLVAGYLGQTALKVEEVVKSALGGILFIDEAYSLSEGGSSDDYGNEAIAALLKLMEDHRDDLIVIVAGYTEKMDAFMASNPGLASRFNKRLNFSDYDPRALLEIFKVFCAKNDFVLSDPAAQTLVGLLNKHYDLRDETFGNGRLARNIFEDTISNQANRIVIIPRVDDEALSMIEPIDLPTMQVTAGS